MLIVERPSRCLLGVANLCAPAIWFDKSVKERGQVNLEIDSISMLLTVENIEQAWSMTTEWQDNDSKQYRAPVFRTLLIASDKCSSVRSMLSLSSSIRLSVRMLPHDVTRIHLLPILGSRRCMQIFKIVDLDGGVR